MAGEIQLNSVTLATESGGVASINSSVNIKGPLNASGSAPIYACRAWVNFDGTFGTSPFTEANGGIRASGNVSSITDINPGRYAVNFTVGMADTDYAMAGSGFNSGNNVPVVGKGQSSNTSTVAYVQTGPKDSAGNADISVVSVAFFR